jgi:hypothetical protein
MWKLRRLTTLGPQRPDTGIALPLPIIVVALSTAWTVSIRWNTDIIGSNPTRDMDVCVRLFCVCVVLYIDSGLATGWSLVQGVLPSVCRIKLRGCSVVAKKIEILSLDWMNKSDCSVWLEVLVTNPWNVVCISLRNMNAISDIVSTYSSRNIAFAKNSRRWIMFKIVIAFIAPHQRQKPQIWRRVRTA